MISPRCPKLFAAGFAGASLAVAAADLAQCTVPEGGESLPNPRGTAPGVFFHRGRTALVMLPGPSLELCPMFEAEVVPAMREVVRRVQ